jgi:hypothetical protein
MIVSMSSPRISQPQNKAQKSSGCSDIRQKIGIRPRHLDANGAGPVVSRKSNHAKILAALGSHGVMFVPNGVVLAT